MDTDKETRVPDEAEDDEIVVVMTDDEGNEFYYIQDVILEVDGEKYALLVPDGCYDDEHECDEHGCDGHECDDEDDAAFFAKIVLDESGEEAYVEPTDEEFDRVLEAYEALMDEEGED